MLDFTFFLLDS